MKTRRGEVGNVRWWDAFAPTHRVVALDLAYFADYDDVMLAGHGHYPMLEAPDAFTAALCARS